MAKNPKRNGDYREGNGKDSSRRGRTNNSRNSRGSKYNSKYTMANDVEKDASHVSDENDPSWYYVNETLLNDVSKISFANQVGLPYEWGQSESVLNKEHVAPGVCQLAMTTIPGIAKSASDGVNIAAQGLFQTIRKDISTYAPYAPADVMMYVLAISSLYDTYCHIKRLFRIINLWSSVNYAYPKTILRACGFTDDAIADFRMHLNNYRSDFNSLVYKASTTYLPVGFSIVERHMWLFSNVYTDADDTKSQIYIHVPNAYWLFDDTLTTQGGGLRPIYTLIKDTVTMSGLLGVFDAQLEAIRNSDSMNKIAADMRRAYGDKTPAWQLSLVSENEILVPIKSDEVLSQIENCTICPHLPADTDPALETWKITQNVGSNTINFQPKWTVSNQLTWVRDVNKTFMSNRILNLHWKNPDAKDIAVATRNMSFIELDPEDPNLMQLTSAGSDIVTGCIIYKYNDVNSNIRTFNTASNMTPQLVSDYLAFDWAPIVYYGSTKSDGSYANNAVYPLADVDNYTMVDVGTLNRMNNNIIMAMWSVPEIGSYLDKQSK